MKQVFFPYLLLLLSLVLHFSSALQEHSHWQTKFDLRCHQCKFVFRDHTSLDLHVKKQHSERPFQCDKCERSYTQKNNLNRHKQNHHENPGSFICGICDKAFNRKDLLDRHMGRHTENRGVQCSECEKRFKTKSGLNAHVNGVHRNKRQYVCDVCGFRTKWNSAYLEHCKLHTGETRKHQLKRKLKLNTSFED